MSRIGKVPIKIPDGVEVKLEGRVIIVAKDGKKLKQEIHPDIKIEIDQKAKSMTLKRPTNNKLHRSLHGLYRALIYNMIVGVTKGFEKKLEIVGVGYRAELKEKALSVSVGYSHPIIFKPPQGIGFNLETPTQITVKGIDKQLVGQVAAKIRSFRPPEPYKGKGIRYVGEYVRRKAGKTAA